MQGKFDVGLDVGSVSVNLVIMNPAGEVVKEEYRRHLGAPSRTALDLLESFRNFPWTSAGWWPAPAWGASAWPRS